MLIIYIDIVLLGILLGLSIFTCAYCFIRVYRLQRSGNVTVLLRPQKVMFSHKKEENGPEELRTVVAYQNPFTGDYCVHKSRARGAGYVNALHSPASSDSGLSGEYEPLHALPPARPHHPDLSPDAPPDVPSDSPPDLSPRQSPDHRNPYETLDGYIADTSPPETTKLMLSDEQNHTINKTWNWNYTEYQI